MSLLHKIEGSFTDHDTYIMEATYSESKKSPKNFSARVGGHSPAKAFNLQKNISREEVEAYKKAPTPEGGLEGWECLGTSDDEVTRMSTDVNRFLPVLLPHNHPDSLADYDVVVAFRKVGYQKIKAFLHNRKSDTFWFVTGTNTKPSEKSVRAAKDGWHLYQSHLTAPAPFWQKFKESTV